MDRSDDAPFTGIRVLDLTDGIPGPTATMYLADFGADVVRAISPAVDPAADPVSVCCSRGKRLVALDPSTIDDRRELRRLMGAADCVVIDWERSQLERLGLDAATARSEHPFLIHAWVPPFGAVGRWNHLPRDPRLLAAVTGIADYHRATEERPVMPVVPVEAYAHGALAAAGIAAALLERTTTGTGRALVVSGLHAVGAMQAAVTVHAAGIVSPALEPKQRIASLPNYAAYRCADGRWIYLGALTQGFFLATLEVLDLLELMVLPGVDGVYANIMLPDIAPQLIERIAARFAERDSDDWLRELDAADVPVAPVGTRDEWFESETVAANAMRAERDHPTLGSVEMPGVPVTLSRTPGSVGELPSTVLEASSIWPEVQATPDRTTGVVDAHVDRPLPLRGLKVVDASSFVAGTFGPSILAHYGASVVKVEPPTGDPYRVFSVSFAAINQAKRGCVLDVKKPAERERLLELVERADVFAENLRPGSRRDLELDWEHVQQRNPRLVHCSVGAYGAGPLGDKPGFDPLLQARSGLMAAQGGSDEPSMSTMLVHDIGTGAIAAFGMLAALFDRERSGQGQHVGTCLANSSLMLQAGEFTRYDGRPPADVGFRDWPGRDACHRVYRCADGWIYVSTDAPPAAIRDALDLPASDASISADELFPVLEGLTVGEAIDRLDVAGVGVAAVLGRRGVFDDPWLLDNRMYHTIEDPELGSCRVVRTYTDWPESSDTAARTSFGLGQHTDEVLEGIRVEHRPGDG